MNIRIAKEDDLPEINSIYNEAIEEQFTADLTPLTLTERRKWFEEHNFSSHPVFVYESNYRVIAWLSFSKYRPGRQALRKTAEISYYVAKDFRRKGVGAALVQFALQQAANYNFSNLLAIVLEHNTGSIRLLEKFGFSKWGYLPAVADFNGSMCGHLYYGINLISI